jgi:hypothetical protein
LTSNISGFIVSLGNYQGAAFQKVELRVPIKDPMYPPRRHQKKKKKKKQEKHLESARKEKGKRVNMYIKQMGELFVLISSIVIRAHTFSVTPVSTNPSQKNTLLSNLPIQQLIHILDQMIV